MPTIKITKLAVERLPLVGIGEQLDYFDTELKGFGVRPNAAAKTYFVMTRVNGRKVHYTIGKHNPWMAETAREEAKEKLRGMGKGEKPEPAKKNSQGDSCHAQGGFREVRKLAPNTIDGYKLNSCCHRTKTG